MIPSLVIDPKQFDELMHSMAMMSLTGRDKRLYLQRMSRYIAAHARKCQKAQRDMNGRPMARKERASDFDGHEWEQGGKGFGKKNIYFGRKTKTRTPMFNKLFKAKNLLITKPEDDSVKIHFRHGNGQGHMGALARMHHEGLPYAYWSTPWPNPVQWRKISDLYRKVKGPLRAKRDAVRGAKMITVKQAMFLSRSGLDRRTPRELFAEVTQALYTDTVAAAQMAGILPKKKKTNSKLTRRPILGANNNQIQTLADFVLSNLGQSFATGKRITPPDITL